jgi:hypothetical protein
VLVPVVTLDAEPAEQRSVGVALNVPPFEPPHEPLTTAGAVLKLATTVQFCVTALVVNELPLGVPPHEPDQEVLLDPDGLAVTTAELPPVTC